MKKIFSTGKTSTFIPSSSLATERNAFRFKTKNNNNNKYFSSQAHTMWHSIVEWLAMNVYASKISEMQTKNVNNTKMVCCFFSSSSYSLTFRFRFPHRLSVFCHPGSSYAQLLGDSLIHNTCKSRNSCSKTCEYNIAFKWTELNGKGPKCTSSPIINILLPTTRRISKTIWTEKKISKTKKKNVEKVEIENF